MLSTSLVYNHTFKVVSQHRHTLDQRKLLCITIKTRKTVLVKATLDIDKQNALIYVKVTLSPKLLKSFTPMLAFLDKLVQKVFPVVTLFVSSFPHFWHCDSKILHIAMMVTVCHRQTILKLYEKSEKVPVELQR